MQLAQGERLGHYRVEEQVGAGGMGEVYRAHDTTLGRDVAIKVLPEELASDPDRLARLEREARLLASVNHPNVATLHGIERIAHDASTADRSRTFLVMELVRGQDLGHRLAAGPMPIAEVLEIAAKIADGLRAAHDQGVIHRDLKPANIRITPDGTVKILDFGLARPWDELPPDEDASEAPTKSLQMTVPGALLGTAPYMSPEQASGRAADRRTDIWALGCVLYEMLSGRPAFMGGSSTEVLARILEVEPDWDALPADVPAELRSLLGRCLEKRVHRRLRDAGDLALTLRGLAEGGLDDTGEGPTRVGRRLSRVLPWVVAAAAVVVAAVAWLPGTWIPPEPEASRTVRFVVTPRVSLDLARLGHSSPAVAVAPDGGSFVFVGAVDGTTALYLRRLVHDQPERIDGTDGAVAPFFSPDGEWVGFWADGRLQKVPVDGGHPQTIAEISHVHGVSWGDNAIVFGGAGDGSLWWVDPGSGEVRTIAERTGGDVWGEYPHLLPDGDAMLVTSRGGTGIDLVSLDTGEVTKIVDEGTGGRYLSSGHLVWAHHGDLLAAPFDLATRRLAGDARTVAEGVLTESSTWTVAQYAVSDDGTFVFLPGGFEIAGQLPTWVTLDGTTRPLNVPVDRYLTPRISPDGRRILLGRHAGTQSLWVAEPEREVMTPVTDDGGEDFWAVWSSDGRDVVFNSIRPEGPANVWRQPVDRGRPPVRLSTAPAHQPPGDLTPDGRSAVVAFATSVTKDSDIHLLPLDGDGSSRPLLDSDADEIHPKLSPDGRWLAYASDVTGRPEVYVQPFPDLGAVVRASPDGGQEPLWSPAGDRLYYRSPSGRQVFAVDVLADEPLQLGRAQLLFEGDYQPGLRWGRLWDLHPDGDRFLMLQVESLQSPTSIQVVVNWSAELEGLVPSGR